MDIYYKSVPFCKNDVTLALESGVDGVIVPAEMAEAVSRLSRIPVLAEDSMPSYAMTAKADEEKIRDLLLEGKNAVLARGWEVIPVENLLAQCPRVIAEAAGLDEAMLASGILQRGVQGIVVLPEAIGELKEIIARCKTCHQHEDLLPAVITRIEPAGLGHRVCIDTTSMLHKGQGMLVGNSSAFTFLVHAETERNEYVASRPFRVNAGAVHAYVRLPGDATAYLAEVKAGMPMLIVDSSGQGSIATAGRVKVEIRPMLLIEAEVNGKRGAVFLQNAETIRLTTPEGEPASVVTLKPGDQVLCRLDEAGRHFGMRIKEDIQEK
ncbi:MAG: 3-dehydroquinate synthase II family protein [Mailhella sp.]|nr:3-dehydroquinate synthase II family protein [Mailhella sp.]